VRKRLGKINTSSCEYNTGMSCFVS
jgi:hypothetical protein